MQCSGAWVLPGCQIPRYTMIGHTGKWAGMTGVPPGCLMGPSRDVLRVQDGHGDPGAIRTPGRLVRSQMLYPLSYGAS